jgi:AbrB family looped-hinge helix DNA binding protein
MSNALSFVRPISRRGQVVVPKDIRTHLGIRNEVVFEVIGDHVEIRPSGEGFLDQFLSLPRQAKSPSPAKLKAIMEQRDADIR